jgi:hypothetical protein
METQARETVSVEATALFADDASLSAAYKAAALAQVSPDTIVKAWASVAKRMLQTGERTLTTGKLKNVSVIVAVDARAFNSTGFRFLEDAGMVKLADSAPSELTPEDFQNWWPTYPKRMRENGIEVKAGKKDAEREFYRNVTTRADFLKLEAATEKYKAATNPKYVMNPERFLRKFWRDYIPEQLGTDVESVAPTQPVVVETNMDALKQLMGRSDEEA